MASGGGKLIGRARNRELNRIGLEAGEKENDWPPEKCLWLLLFLARSEKSPEQSIYLVKQKKKKKKKLVAINLFFQPLLKSTHFEAVGRRM